MLRFCHYSTDPGRCARCLAETATWQGTRRALTAELLTTAAAVVFPSDFLRQIHGELFPGVPADARRRWCVVEPPIASTSSLERRTPGPLHHAALVGSVQPHKGAAVFAETVRLLEGEGLRWSAYGGGDAEHLAETRLAAPDPVAGVRGGGEPVDQGAVEVEEGANTRTTRARGDLVDRLGEHEGPGHHPIIASDAGSRSGRPLLGWTEATATRYEPTAGTATPPPMAPPCGLACRHVGFPAALSDLPPPHGDRVRHRGRCHRDRTVGRRATFRARHRPQRIRGNRRVLPGFCGGSRVRSHGRGAGRHM